MTEHRDILCGSCKVVMQERTEPNGQVMGVCPSCGETDTLENIMREVSDYMVSKVADDLLDPFTRNTQDHSFIKITVTKPEKRSYRFIASDEATTGR
jgi:hypothetical protein